MVERRGANSFYNFGDKFIGDDKVDNKNIISFVVGA